MDSTFAKLNAINVNEHIDKKGNFSYLSSVRHAELTYPTLYKWKSEYSATPYSIGLQPASRPQIFQIL